MESETEGEPVWVWFGLIIVAAASFWTQATVTEERFVPALNVIANHFNIPDDVAGATLMAAGASSPELFSAIVALFITHSSLGIGTIVGSEIFNQLVICAGAALEARNGHLVLDKPIVVRETGFYALSIILLYNALSVSKPLDSDPNGPNHLFVSLFPSALLVLAYILYVLTMAYFEQILTVLGVKSGQELTEEEIEANQREETQRGVSYGAIDVMTQDSGSLRGGHGTMFIRQKSFRHEPLQNFRTGYSKGESRGASFGSESGSFGAESSHSIRSLREKMDVFDTSRSNDSKRYFKITAQKETSDNIRDLEKVEVNLEDKSLSCYMWHRSEFYTHSRTAMKAWLLRWMTFSDKGIFASSSPNPDSSSKTRKYPKFDSILVDPTANLVTMKNSQNVDSKFTLMAPTTEILDEVVHRCELLLDTWTMKEEGNGKEHEDEQEYADCDEAESLLAVPHGSSEAGLVFHYSLLPLKALMQYTIPDVRGRKADPIGAAGVSSFMCVVWLIFGSYFMVWSLEYLADLMNIPDSIVGVTVSAAGTSLPNYVASQVAARQGLGNMAVSNAFGSNVFNIFVGLGLPWLLYICFVTKGADYTDLLDDGIVENVLILASVLLFFVVLMLITGFVLVRWHAYAFLAMYTIYVFYNIGLVYLW